MAAILLADVGGTNARLALARDGEVLDDSLTRFAGQDFASFDEVLRSYLDEQGNPALEALCVAVAGPVAGGRARLTNRDWSFSEDNLARIAGVGRARLINDLVALGYGVPGLSGAGVADLLASASPRPDNGQALVVNAGTGFNVCAVHRAQDGRITCLESEEGHTRLPDSVSLALRDLLGGAAAPFTSVEELFAGRGLALLHRQRTGRPALRAEEVTSTASEGDPEADATLRIYAQLLGLHCRELTMRFLPYSGIYLAGSVARACVAQIDVFADAYRRDLLMRELVEATPVRMICDDLAALQGCLAAVR